MYSIDDGRLFYQTPTKLVCLDYCDGQTLWSTDFGMSLPISAGKVKTGELQWEAPTLVVNNDLVMVSYLDGGIRVYQLNPMTSALRIGAVGGRSATALPRDVFSPNNSNAAGGPKFP
jgi:outer membrane protein assembly factor BamB